MLHLHFPQRWTVIIIKNSVMLSYTEVFLVYCYHPLCLQRLRVSSIRQKHPVPIEYIPLIPVKLITHQSKCGLM